VLRAHLALDPAVASPTWIATRFATTSTDVPPAVQQGITLALRPRYDVHWVSGGVDVAKRGGSFLALPAIPSSGNRIHVRLGTYCGNVCGTSAGWIVTRHGGHWSARPDGSGVAMA
jgi:hypothetical protein